MCILLLQLQIILIIQKFTWICGDNLNLCWLQLFDVADEEVRKMEKKYKEGSHVRVRILGFRNLEGLAMGTLKVILPSF